MGKTLSVAVERGKQRFAKHNLLLGKGMEKDNEKTPTERSTEELNGKGKRWERLK